MTKITIDLFSEQTDKIVVSELMHAIKIQEENIFDEEYPLRGEELRQAKKTIKAMKRVINYFGVFGEEDSYELS